MSFWFPSVLAGTVPLPLDHEQRLSTVDFLSDDPLSVKDSKDFRLSVTHSGSGYHRSFKTLIIALRWTRAFLHLFSSSSSIKLLLTEGNWHFITRLSKECRRIEKRQSPPILRIEYFIYSNRKMAFSKTKPPFHMSAFKVP